MVYIAILEIAAALMIVIAIAVAIYRDWKNRGNRK